MSISETFAKITGSPVGKISIGVVAVAAVAFAVIAATHVNSGEESRVVTPTQVQTDAQKQIDAINGMTNLTAAQKQSMIAHEQGEIDKAKTGGGGGRVGPPGK